MVCYVDDMFRYNMGRFRNMRMSHMMADSDIELHAMAKKIGVKRCWYQGDHYDICRSKRQLAIHHGAVPVTLQQMACMAWFKREGEPMGDPATALERRMARRRDDKRINDRMVAIAEMPKQKWPTFGLNVMPGVNL